MTKLKVKVCQNESGNWFATIDEPDRTTGITALHGYFVHEVGCTSRTPKYYPTREALRGAIRQYNAMNEMFQLVGGLH